MKSLVLSSALLAGAAYAQNAGYDRCGGIGFTGVSTCVSGFHCQYWNPYYSQCVPGAATTLQTVTTSAQSSGASSSTPSPSEVAPVSSDLSEVVSSTKVVVSTAVRQSSTPSKKASSSTPVKSSVVALSSKISSSSAAVIPVATSSKEVATSSAVAKTVQASSTKVAVATSTSVKATSTASASGKITFAGINIAGFDFGCGTDGTCSVSGVDPPLTSSNGADGIGQMQHFYNDDNLNVFRLPVGWQYLQADYTDSDLDSTNLAVYDKLVQGCLATGAYCVIDIHNYARWNGAIIGQGGPTNAEFANFWSKLAGNYASESKIIFGVMNEPHDVDITEWAATVQEVVTAIREAGATSQYILLPGNNYASAASFISNGSGAALLNVTNTDGTTDNLIFDVHQYLDSDNSGTSTECVTNNIDSAFEPLATWLRSNGRLAFNTESGGGNVASCETYLCEQYAYLDSNSDVFLGRVGWAAGSFATSYALTETPTESGSTWTDTALVSACIAR